MKREEIIAGQIYCANFKNTNEDYIYEAPGKSGYNGYMHTKTKAYYNHFDITHDWTSGYTVRLATASEIAHFKLCEASGKYIEVPKDAIINEYQIY